MESSVKDAIEVQPSKKRPFRSGMTLEETSDALYRDKFMLAPMVRVVRRQIPTQHNHQLTIHDEGPLNETDFQMSCLYNRGHFHLDCSHCSVALIRYIYCCRVCVKDTR
jgi:hypothetical protein